MPPAPRSFLGRPAPVEDAIRCALIGTDPEPLTEDESGALGADVDRLPLFGWGSVTGTGSLADACMLPGGRRVFPIGTDGRAARLAASVGIVDATLLDQAVAACRSLIDQRFPHDGHAGAAAMLLADGTVLTGTAPDAINPSVEVCHEIEPYCAAFRLGQPVAASVCLHRQPGGRVVVLSPCGVCRERLAVHGPDVMVGVAAALDSHRDRVESTQGRAAGLLDDCIPR